MSQKIYCEKCEDFTDNVYVDSHLDKENGWKCRESDNSWKYSCRGIRSEYATVKCEKCGAIRTYDFSRD